LCIHGARNFDEYTQVLAGDTTNKMAFLGGEEGAALKLFKSDGEPCGDHRHLFLLKKIYT
jgi:hypothetical protein